MPLKEVLSLSTWCTLLLLTAMASPNPVALAQDLSKTVFPITQLKLLGPAAELNFATGFCVSEDCRCVGTNYHVAMMAQVHKLTATK